MKRVIFAVLAACLAMGVSAQSLTVGGGAIAGSHSASQALALVAIGQTGGVANLGAVAKNEGTAQAAASSGLVIAPTPALVSAGTANSLNTSTITTSGEVPVGGAGIAGGSGSGNSYAGVGVIYYLTTTTPGPVAPPVLPSIGGPIIAPLPALPPLLGP